MMLQILLLTDSRAAMVENRITLEVLQVDLNLAAFIGKKMNPIRAAIRFYQLRSSWLGDGGQPVSAVQANARAAVCLKCPMNQKVVLESLREDIVSWALKIDRLKEQLGIRCFGEQGLHVCTGCWCVLKHKVFVPIEHVKKTTDLTKLHKDCWILAEIA